MGVVEVERRIRLSEGYVGLVESRDGADVLPVAIEGKSVNAHRFDSGRDDVIAEVIAAKLERNLAEVGVYGRQGMVGERTRPEIGVHAIRGGDIVGDHTVLFAGTGERLEITHRAQSRETFAQGALRATRWVVNAPKGLHDIGKVLFGE